MKGTGNLCHIPHVCHLTDTLCKYEASFSLPPYVHFHMDAIECTHCSRNTGYFVQVSKVGLPLFDGQYPNEIVCTIGASVHHLPNDGICHPFAQPQRVSDHVLERVASKVAQRDITNDIG